VLNSLRDAGAGFTHDTNKVTLFTADGQKRALPLKTKQEVAADVVRVIEEALAGH
jgi:phosphopantothenoylcysteine decarboxylase/phosphopantothenate--cysteine ligase